MLHRFLSVLLLTAPLAAQGPGGMPGMGASQKLLDRYDADKNGRLDSAERHAAMTALAAQPAQGGRGFGPGGRGGPGGGASATPTAGKPFTPKDVRNYPKAPFFADSVIRTVFLTFEDADWEQQLEAFNNSDVEVPARVSIDGVPYKDVGVHFRGMSSYFMVQRGQKRSLNLSFDWVEKAQAVQGIRTINLLNAHEDPTFLRSMLYYQVASHYVQAPKANFVRVVINGESWGLYTSVEQFNKDFIRDHYATTDGARWKVPGSPGARGGLEHLGDTIASYRRNYEIKSKDDSASWRALITLTRVLNTTAPAQLEAALGPILDIDGALRFLALEVTLVNNDGYWTRASDYSIYRDVEGIFHILPQDANETFSNGGGPGGPGGFGGRGGPPGGFPGGPPPGAMPGGMPPGGMPPGGMRGGPGGPGGMMMGNAELDPLVNVTDATKPLRSKLLAVPALRARYLAYVREIATTWLDWKNLGPLVTRYDKMIAADVAADTKKLESTEAYTEGLKALQAFAEKRRAFVLGWQPK